MSQDELVSQYVHVPRLEAGSKESLEHLESEGYVVIKNALSSREADHALDLTWDFLEELGTGVDRTDTSTWGDDRWPVNVHGGIIPSQGIGHSAAQWFIRSRPAVKSAFASVWDDEDLLVSFDGMALWRPASIDPSWATARGGRWLHIDQHPVSRPGLQCVQGAVTLTPTSPSIGGNVLIPGSHRWFADIPNRYAERLGRLPEMMDHFRFPADDPQLQDTPPIMCHMEAGDMMLWDSRTVHCSSPGPGPELDAGAAPALLRVASLVCMMPRARSNDEVIAHRRAAVSARTSTTNWSDRWINADEFPQVVSAGDSGKYRLPPIPELDEYQLALVG
jgi:ectoine hydroxylase-related dioxygenase (phytanoyl-CoA dioxygenase family)